MRALHLCFWLHHPYELLGEGKWEKGYFGGELGFRKLDQKEYQPFFALIERNAQRYPKLHLSLVVSGVWLEQVERWDVDLLARLKKLVASGSVELVTVPYYASMAAFYDLEEFSEQVAKLQNKFEQVFGEKSLAVAVPGLCYNNRLARWAEKAGFRLMLAGDATNPLDWRTCNKLYEAKGKHDGEALKVLFENRKLSQMLMQAEALATVQIAEEITIDQPDVDSDMAPKRMTTAADFVQALQQQREQAEPDQAAVTHSAKKVRTKTSFSAKKFIKQLDLAFMRGEVVNLQLTPEIFERWREYGVIGFFDELFKLWLEAPGNQLLGVKELLQLAPAAEISIKKTVSMDGDAQGDYQSPEWWTEAELKRSQDLYDLRADVMRSKDRGLQADFAMLTTREYALGGEQYDEILADFRERLAKYRVKMLNGEEKVTGRSLTESTAVEVKIDHEARAARERKEKFYEQFRLAGEAGQAFWDVDDMDDMEAAIQVFAQRMKWSSLETERNLDTYAEAEVVDDNMGFEAADIDIEEEPVAPPKPKKKRFKKIVIE